jgi:hypothetical protein
MRFDIWFVKRARVNHRIHPEITNRRPNQFAVGDAANNLCRWSGQQVYADHLIARILQSRDERPTQPSRGSRHQYSHVTMLKADGAYGTLSINSGGGRFVTQLVA